MSYHQIGNVAQIQITTEKKVILGSDPAHMLNFIPERAQAFDGNNGQKRNRRWQS